MLYWNGGNRTDFTAHAEAVVLLAFLRLFRWRAGCVFAARFHFTDAITQNTHSRPRSQNVNSASCWNASGVVRSAGGLCAFDR